MHWNKSRVYRKEQKVGKSVPNKMAIIYFQTLSILIFFENVLFGLNANTEHEESFTYFNYISENKRCYLLKNTKVWNMKGIIFAR